FSSYGLGVAAIGVLKAVYPAVWGITQVVFGPLSDRIGRKWLIAGGLMVQAVGIWQTVLVPTYTSWLLAALLQGLGTAMVYPTLLPLSVTWLSRSGVRPRWGCTACGGTRAMQWARCCPASSPTCSACAQRFIWLPRSR